MKFTQIEEKLGYSFTKKQFLEEALTHPSKKIESKKVQSYQRLEFIGDKVLNFVIAAELFRLFPNEQEGEISRRHSNLVAGQVCNKVAIDVGILEYIIFSKAQLGDSSYRHDKVGEDVIEAIIGAIFIDGQIEHAKQFVLHQWERYIKADISPPKDAKSQLQEYFQKHFQSLPYYNITKAGNNFIAQVTVNNKVFEATARTKKEAEKLVAQEAVIQFNNA